MNFADCGCPTDSEFIYHHAECSNALSGPHFLSCSAKDARIAQLEAAVEVARRWAKRKGHGQDHDCDLCNAIRRAGEG